MSDKQPSQQAALDEPQSRTYDHTYDALHYTVNPTKGKPKHLTAPNFGKVEPLSFWDDLGIDPFKSAYSKIVQFDIDHLKNSF